MQSVQGDQQIDSSMTWWEKELSMDEKLDIRKAWLVLLSSEQVKKGPQQTLSNIQVIMGYLKETNEFWTDVDPNGRPRKSLKYNNIYQLVYALTNDRPTGSGKSTPKRLSLSTTADD